MRHREIQNVNLADKFATLCVLGAGLTLAACAVPPTNQEPVYYSEKWFQCEGRFDCIVVYDAYCRFTPVNASFARTYEAWAHQEVRQANEQIFCEPAGKQPVPLPYCHDQHCELR